MDPEQFTVEDHPDRTDVDLLNDRINEFNFATTGIRDGGELAIFLREDDGNVQAGLYGWTWGGTLHIQYLWVDEALRGKGYGRRILEAAEAEGRARGCRQAVLSTHSFQAPDFYRRMGYEVRGTYDDYPAGYQKVYLRKALSMTPVTQLTVRFEDALAYAARIHATQVRKGSGIPYIAHLLGVTSIALDYGADEDEAIAALLHDAIEDVGPEVRDEIRARYGENVLAIVEGCTDTDQRPKPPWRKRKEAYIEHIAGSSPSILLVSASDKLHNARAILTDYRVLGDGLWNRFKGGKEGTLWYYRTLIEAFCDTGANPMLVDELDRVVTELEGAVGDFA